MKAHGDQRDLYLAPAAAAAGLVVVTIGSITAWPRPAPGAVAAAVYVDPSPTVATAFALRVGPLPLGLLLVVLAAVAPIALLTRGTAYRDVTVLLGLATAGSVALVAAAHGISTAGPFLALAGSGIQITAALWAARPWESSE